MNIALASIINSTIVRKYIQLPLLRAGTHIVAALTAKALVIHDQDDKDVRIESGLCVARSWPDARFKRTYGLGHRKILRDQNVIAATADFLANRVEFLPPPQVDE